MAVAVRFLSREKLPLWIILQLLSDQVVVIGEHETLMELILCFLLQLMLSVCFLLRYLPFYFLLLCQQSGLLLWIEHHSASTSSMCSLRQTWWVVLSSTCRNLNHRSGTAFFLFFLICFTLSFLFKECLKLLHLHVEEFPRSDVLRYHQLATILLLEK